MLLAYKLWHEYLSNFPKITRYTLGEKIDFLFIETIENIFIAVHKDSDQKAPYLAKASDKFDILKFLLQVAWEVKAIDNKKYIALSKKLNEIGRMLGGWLKTQAPHKNGAVK